MITVTTTQGKHVDSCALMVIDEIAEMLAALSRDEFYYYYYPAGISPILGLSNLPLSPLVSRLDAYRRLKSIEISRKYNSMPGNKEDVINGLMLELNSVLGTNYTKEQAEIIYSQYGLAVAEIGLGIGSPGHLYTPESVAKCQEEYMTVFSTLTTGIIFSIAAQLNPFDANGNIKFKPDPLSKYYNADGSLIYPENDGFLDGYKRTNTLKAGTIIDRYGEETGRFASPVDTPLSMRSLPPGSQYRNYYKYEVLEDIQVESGLIAPYYNQPGGGVQYKFSNPIQYYIENDYLKQIS